MANPKQTSPIWKYFIIDEKDSSKAYCLLCKKNISRGGKGKTASTTPLYGHLKSMHSGEHKKMLENNKKQSSSSKSNSHSNLFLKDSKQLSVQDYVEKRQMWEIKNSKSVQIHYKIGEMICLDNQPYSIVHNEGFKRLMLHAFPLYTIPSRTYFTNNIIPDIYSRLRNKITLSLQKAEYISFTSDIWTCQANNESFISLTGHWLEPITLERYHAVLNCEHFSDSHTGINISEKFEYMLNSWNISKSKIHIVIRDGGANMVKGCNELETESLSCFIHSLQLVILEAMKSQRAVLDTIAVARKIVGHFSHSPAACSKLKQIQDDLNIANRKLIQDISTRWNSTYYMLERLYEEKRAICIYANEHAKISSLTKTQWDLVAGLIQVNKNKLTFCCLNFYEVYYF